MAAVLSALRPGAGPWWVFAAVAILLLLIARSLLASRPWALAVSFVLLASQVVGVVGTTLQFAYGIDAGKAGELRALGLDRRLGVSVNLAFSLAAVVVLGTTFLRAKNP
ncbi:MAG TPA: hypothetical protein VN909_02600 [Candidatus Dormibacteraeota bacterium]|nr:hypothetical protein [Candidatus Dormibacteraeota bacterium]